MAHLDDLQATKRIILASESPRRRELLGTIIRKFEVMPSGFKENLAKVCFGGPQDYAIATAKGKGEDVVSRISTDGPVTDTIVIAADTVVDLGGEIFEKPKSEQEAKEMLRSLSGKEHLVHTGVFIWCDNRTEVFSETTKVKFTEISNKAIEAYVKTGEPMDKAGSYGVQALGQLFVEEITGCYQNVMGFPLFAIGEHLEKMLWP